MHTVFQFCFLIYIENDPRIKLHILNIFIRSVFSMIHTDKNQGNYSL